MEVERSTQVDDDERGELKKKLFIKYWKFKFLFSQFLFWAFSCCSRCSTLSSVVFCSLLILLVSLFSMFSVQCTLHFIQQRVRREEESKQLVSYWEINFSFQQHTNLTIRGELHGIEWGGRGLECCRRRRKRLRAYRTITTENYSLKLELSFAAAFAWMLKGLLLQESKELSHSLHRLYVPTIDKPLIISKLHLYFPSCM